MKTLFAILSIGPTRFAQAQTSEKKPNLKDALERYPEADANGDGELTLEEAKALRR